MKQQSIILAVLAAFFCIIFSSYDYGPASVGLNRSGSAGVANCTGSGCHAANNTATTVTMALTDNASGTVVTDGKYKAGNVYQVKLMGSNATSLPRFGFQVSTVKTVGNAQIGTFSNLPANTHQMAVAGINIVEHTAPLLAVSGTYSVSFNWTAPAAGTGSVTFYTIINAVNFNGSETGDAPNAASFVFTETPTAVKNVAGVLQLHLYPNPAGSSISVTVGNGVSKEYRLKIYSASGLLVSEQMIRMNGVNSASSINIAALSSGLYYLNLTGTNESGVQAFIKK